MYDDRQSWAGGSLRRGVRPRRPENPEIPGPLPVKNSWPISEEPPRKSTVKDLARHSANMRKGRSLKQASVDLVRLFGDQGVRGIASRTFHELSAALSPSAADLSQQDPSSPRLLRTHPFDVVLSGFCDLSEEVLRENLEVVNRFPNRPTAVHSSTWFLHAFAQSPYGGVHTILRLMDWMKARHDVEHRLVIYDNQEISDKDLRSSIAAAFPSLRDIDIVLPAKGRVPLIDLSELPPPDIAVCTIWYSAYCLARFNATKAKFYLVQDFEPAFYPAGTLWAL